jgi:hypothetical protein
LGDMISTQSFWWLLICPHLYTLYNRSSFYFP